MFFAICVAIYVGKNGINALFVRRHQKKKKLLSMRLPRNASPRGARQKMRKITSRYETMSSLKYEAVAWQKGISAASNGAAAKITLATKATANSLEMTNNSRRLMAAMEHQRRMTVG